MATSKILERHLIRRAIMHFTYVFLLIILSFSLSAKASGLSEDLLGTYENGEQIISQAGDNITLTDKRYSDESNRKGLVLTFRTSSSGEVDQAVNEKYFFEMAFKSGGYSNLARMVEKVTTSNSAVSNNGSLLNSDINLYLKDESYFGTFRTKLVLKTSLAKEEDCYHSEKCVRTTLKSFEIVSLETGLLGRASEKALGMLTNFMLKIFIPINYYSSRSIHYKD